MEPYFQLWRLFNPCKTTLITSVEKGEICLIKLLRNQRALQLSETTANFIWEKDCVFGGDGVCGCRPALCVNERVLDGKLKRSPGFLHTENSL